MLLWRRNLYLLLAMQIVSMVGFSMVFPFLPLYVKQLGIRSWGTVEFWSGAVFASQAITMMISAPLWGVVADRYGRKMMLVRASLGGAVLLAAMGFVQSAEQLTLIRAIQGLVTGTIAAANALVAATTPKEHTGEAMGLLQTGNWIGVAVGPLIGGVIGDAIGFRESFWITSVLLAISGISVLLWVKEDFTPQPRDKTPRFLGSFNNLLRSPKLIYLYTVAFLDMAGRMMLFPVAALFIMELMQATGGAASLTGLMLGIRAAAGSISAVWLGRLGDRLGHTRILMMALVATVVCYLPQALVTAPWQLIMLQALCGFANGGLIPSLSALMNLHTAPDSLGATFGLNASINSAARVLAPMLGAAFAMWFGLRSIFLITAVIYILAVLTVVWFRRTESGEVENPQYS